MEPGNRPKKYINFNKIIDMFGGEEEFLEEFCEVAISSFSKFRDEFRLSLRNRDLQHLRHISHRVKPVAQQLSVEVISIECQKAKQRLIHEESDEMLNRSIENVEHICNEIIKEFRERLNSI